MAWVNPITWVVNQLVTAAQLNQHIRDNMLYLKERTDAADLAAGAPFVTTADTGALSNEQVLGTAILMEGTLAARPAAGVRGRIYITNNEAGGRIAYYDSGAEWVRFAHPASTTPVDLTAHAARHEVGGADAVALSDLLIYGADAAVPDANAGTTMFGYPGSTKSVWVQDPNMGLPVPRSGTIRRLYVRVRSHGGAYNSSTTITVYKNGVATSLAVVIPSGAIGNATTFSNTTNSFTVVPGDLILFGLLHNDNQYGSHWITSVVAEFV